MTMMRPWQESLGEAILIGTMPVLALNVRTACRPKLDDAIR